MESEKLCLQWNDFQANINVAFQSLREDDDFNDVTLVCEDGTQIEAHKVVLSTSSPMLQNMLRRNKHTHPLHYGLSPIEKGKFKFLNSKPCYTFNCDPKTFKPFLNDAKL